MQQFLSQLCWWIIPTPDKLHCICSVGWHVNCVTLTAKALGKASSRNTPESSSHSASRADCRTPSHTDVNIPSMGRRLSDTGQMQQNGRCAVTAEYTGKSFVYTTSNETKFSQAVPIAHYTHAHSGALEDGRVALSNELLQLVIRCVLAVHSIYACLCRSRVQGTLEGFVRLPQPLGKVVLNAAPSQAASGNARALDVLAASDHSEGANLMYQHHPP